MRSREVFTECVYLGSVCTMRRSCACSHPGGDHACLCVCVCVCVPIGYSRCAHVSWSVCINEGGTSAWHLWVMGKNVNN